MVGFNLLKVLVLTTFFSGSLTRNSYRPSVHTDHQHHSISESSESKEGHASPHQDPTRDTNKTVVNSDHKAQGLFCFSKDHFGKGPGGRRLWLMENEATLKCCNLIGTNCVAKSWQGRHPLHLEYDYYCLFRNDDQRRELQLCCSQDKLHFEIETPQKMDLPCPKI